MCIAAHICRCLHKSQEIKVIGRCAAALGTEFGSSARAEVLLTTEPSLQQQCLPPLETCWGWKSNVYWMLILDQIIHVCYFQFSQQNLQGREDCYCFFSAHEHVCKHPRKRQGEEGRERGGGGRRDRNVFAQVQRPQECIGGVLLFHFLLSFFEPGVCCCQQCWLADWPYLSDLPVGTLPCQCWVTDEESHVQFFRMLGIQPQVPGLCIKNFYPVNHLLFLINVL